MENLPIEILFKIAEYIPILFLARLGTTCTQFRNILSEQIQEKRILLLLRQCYTFGYDELSESKNEIELNKEIHVLIHTNPNLLNNKHIYDNYYIYTLKKKFFNMCKPSNYIQCSKYLDEHPILLESDLIQTIISELAEDYNRN